MATKEGLISRYIGTASESKPASGLPIGSTYHEYDEGVLMITPDSGSTWVIKDVKNVEFTFRPGQAAMASGMVAGGTRSYNPETVSTAAAASTTVWSSTITFSPYQSGLIDGLSANGIIEGALTIGVIASASTPTAKLTARIQNIGETTSWVTILGLTGTISTSSVVSYQTYDIPYLQTSSPFNAVPFGVAIGIQSSSSVNTIQARLMESSYVMGSYIPGA